VRFCHILIQAGVTYVLRISAVHSQNVEGEMETSRSVPWHDLARDLEDPEFLREYLESVRISTIDQVVQALNDAREAAGLSKAALARAISAEPAAMRRLFSAGQVNPTLGTLAEVAAALGMRITVEPLPAAERNQVTTPVLQGRSSDTCPWWSTWLGCAHPDVGKQF
jgi:DNA-binding phage protein